MHALFKLCISRSQVCTVRSEPKEGLTWLWDSLFSLRVGWQAEASRERGVWWERRPRASCGRQVPSPRALGGLTLPSSPASPHPASRSSRAAAVTPSGRDGKCAGPRVLRPRSRGSRRGLAAGTPGTRAALCPRPAGHFPFPAPVSSLRSLHTGRPCPAAVPGRAGRGAAASLGCDPGGFTSGSRSGGDGRVQGGGDGGKGGCRRARADARDPWGVTRPTPSCASHPARVHSAVSGPAAPPQRGRRPPERPWAAWAAEELRSRRRLRAAGPPPSSF